MIAYKVSQQPFERIYWLIRLRWIAVASVPIAAFFATRILGLSPASLPIYTIAIFLGIYNLAFLLYLNHISRKASPGSSLLVNRIANAQIILDLVSLTALVHFSGGIENPFIFYFIFHMIIAGILLSQRASFLQATFAILLFCTVVILEYQGVLTHYCLKGFIASSHHRNLLYIAGIFFVFISTLYIAVYMASSIAKRLREKEARLKQANEQLEEKDRIKSEYVLRVSHDIKEHLSAIQGCLEPVTMGITGTLNEKQADLLRRADARTEKLMFFVKALLEITRIKLSQEIEMREFSLTKTIENALGFIEAKAKAKRILINYHLAQGTIENIRGAEIYIEEAISNLLANAVKYTPADGRINIAVAERDNFILISISDTGIGIPEDETSKVWNEFYRGSNAKELERDGTGLGLSLAKQVVERHKGKIWVESREGRGSTFYIELPKC